MMHRNASVDTHRFAMTPKADIPRSSFGIQKSHKTTFDSGFLVPIYVDEILPGDTFSVKMTAFARLATPIFPTMDNLYMDTFFFFVPNRLVWNNWQKLMGEQDAPGDSISFTVPQITSPVGGYPPLSIFDYMGLPTVGQVNASATVTHSSMWLRAYNLIYNEWFRDENLCTPVKVTKTDGPDVPADFALLKRGKRHDYFTSCLPWPQKGASVALPLGGRAAILSDGGPLAVFGPTGTSSTLQTAGTIGSNVTNTGLLGAGELRWGPPDGGVAGMFTDLTQATAATINQLRQAFQIQKLLERDARGGTRYTEIIRAHFGVQSPDARLQRPEYLGGGSTPIVANPIAQTGPTAADVTPLGTLGAMATALASNHGFHQSFVEHGMIIGLVSVRADLHYQQGLRKMWSRKTRYDFYFPAFAHLGEQAVLSKEIYADGTAGDEEVFGYQERWSEYRYNPSNITGLFRSTTTGTIDNWHLAQRFLTRPTLAQTFIQENVPLERTLAVGTAANGQQLIMDSFFNIKAARAMPAYSTPGLIDHF
ncbi:MAG: major capsid protein [Microvirus sp.]|nr:MAG: major capsid protein [Microvirus sp.]